MVDGKIITILGKRGQGKTSLMQTLFNNAKKLSFYISIFRPNFKIDNCLIHNNLNDLLRKEKEKNKNKRYCIFNLNDVKVLLNILSKYNDINIFIDEIRVYFEKGKVIDEIDYLIRYTRTQNINLILTTHRPKAFTPDILSLSDLYVLFKLDNIRDVQYLEGCHIDTSKLPILQPFQFITQGNSDILNNL